MLHMAIAAGLVLGLVVGLGAAATGNEWLHMIAQGSAPFGAIFMNAIRMVVIPLIITVIFTSIARLGDPRKLGRIGGITIAFYWISLIPAIAIGMLTMKFGLRFASDIEMPQAAATDVPELQSIVDFIISLVPANPFAAASSGAILPLIVFTALVAAATGTLPAERRERLINLAEDGSEALIKLVWWILYVAPIGVFGLAAPVTAKLGWDLVQSLGIFIVCVFVGLVIFLALVTLPLMYFIGGISPIRYIGGIFGGLSVAVSTTSTAAAIPVTLEETTKNLKVSTTIADLLVPLGASMHRPGSALFQGQPSCSWPICMTCRYR
jgi:Na+/H+-dicarboxylate symporter